MYGAAYFSYFVVQPVKFTFKIYHYYNIILSYILSCMIVIRYLTVDPHIAGSDRNDELAGDLVTQWNSYGFDNVNMYNYTVLLTFPNKSSLNVLNIVSSNDFDHVLFEANTTIEKSLAPGEDNPNVVPPYNAYSGNGAVNVSTL